MYEPTMINIRLVFGLRNDFKESELMNLRGDKKLYLN